MEFIKKNWKNILITFLCILFVVECSERGNYTRKYKKEAKRVEYILDSTDKFNHESKSIIDSLNTTIKFKDAEIENLSNQLSIYKTQNERLSNKKIEIIIPSANESESSK